MSRVFDSRRLLVLLPTMDDRNSDSVENHQYSVRRSGPLRISPTGLALHENQSGRTMLAIRPVFIPMDRKRIY